MSWSWLLVPCYYRNSASSLTRIRNFETLINSYIRNRGNAWCMVVCSAGLRNNACVEQTTAWAFPPPVLLLNTDSACPENLTLLWMRTRGITRIFRFPRKRHGRQLCNKTTTNRRTLRNLNILTSMQDFYRVLAPHQSVAYRALLKVHLRLSNTVWKARPPVWVYMPLS